MIQEQVFAQALLITGELEDKKRELLRLLCNGAASALTLRLKAGMTAQDCAGDFITAASLQAVASLLDTREDLRIEEFKAGDLTVKQSGHGGDNGAKVLRQQAEELMKPYFADRFSFVGV